MSITRVRIGSAERARAPGLELVGLAHEDLVLPGELKSPLVRVAEAKAEAPVITRREAAASARLLSQTAKVLAQSPEPMRPKVLEAHAEPASEVGKREVVLGESALGRLKLVSPS